MCITLHASQLSGTKIYAGEATRDGRYVHVLAYQNNATNSRPGPNAMVLPIPSASAMGAENAIDTRAFKGFLGDIAEATKQQSFSRSRGISKGTVLNSALPAVFDVGSYTVVLGTDMEAAVQAVASVPENKRPELNADVLTAMAALYPGWSFAICCWDGKIEAEPLLWWYEPKAPSLLFAPSVDAHDGGPPKEGPVPVDAIVTFGSTLKPTGEREVRYRTAPPPEVKALLPTRAVGEKIKGRLDNGDFWYPVANFDGHADIEDTMGGLRKSQWRPKPALRFFPGMGTAKTEVRLGQWD